jgi:phage gpG-like protein
VVAKGVRRGGGGGAVISGNGVRIDLSELEDILGQLAEAGEHPGEEVMRAAGADLADGVQEEFETEGHGRWAPLADSTLRSRRGSTGQILVDSGVLRGSIDEGSVRAGDDWVELTTPVEYSVYHVSDAPRTVIPKRDFFDIHETYLARAVETVLDGVLTEAGFRQGAA